MLRGWRPPPIRRTTPSTVPEGPSSHSRADKQMRRTRSAGKVRPQLISPSLACVDMAKARERCESISLHRPMRVNVCCSWATGRVAGCDEKLLLPNCQNKNTHKGSCKTMYHVIFISDWNPFSYSLRTLEFQFDTAGRVLASAQKTRKTPGKRRFFKHRQIITFEIIGAFRGFCGFFPGSCSVNSSDLLRYVYPGLETEGKWCPMARFQSFGWRAAASKGLGAPRRSCRAPGPNAYGKKNGEYDIGVLYSHTVLPNLACPDT